MSGFSVMSAVAVHILSDGRDGMALYTAFLSEKTIK